MKGAFQSVAQLIKGKYAPHVYVFKNIESGQVLYTQLPYHSEEQIKRQFQRPNWENKRPKPRPDLWRLMAVAEFESYENAVAAYEGLLELRALREIGDRKNAESMRKRNEDKNIWYSAQFRPTWAQEAVADIATVVDEYELETTILWENLWRKGDDKHWNLNLVTHDSLPPFNPRDQHVLLNELRVKAAAEFAKLRLQNEPIDKHDIASNISATA